MLKKQGILVLGLLIVSLLSMLIFIKNWTTIVQTATFNLKNTPKGLKTFEKVKIIKVIDGDTVVFIINEKKETARLIGVNTPEKGDCYYEEATLYLQKKVEHKTISLFFDLSQNKRDKYKRLLVYLWRDNIFINEEIILLGMGKEYTFNNPYYYQKKFRNVEKVAKNRQNGLWRSCKNIN